MAKFCGKCGTRLDDTGVCPRCNAGQYIPVQNHPAMNSETEITLSRKEKKRRMKQEKLASMTIGQKVMRFFLRMCLWIVLWGLLCAAIAGGLVCFDIIDIPVFDDIIHKIELSQHKEHEWIEATCIDAEMCAICGETGKRASGHNWIAATCTTPKTCSVCKETNGVATGHLWCEATYETPKTCQICGKTDGEPLKPNPIYLCDMEYSDKYGKVYYHDNKNANYVNNSDWKDLYTPGHIQRIVCDGYGNTFTCGLHMDGDQLGPYYITYSLDGKYAQFSGWCVLPDYKAGSADAKNYSKYFEIYCDGKLVFTSNTMRNGSMSQYFEIDITDVDVLTIQYAPTTGPNDLAVLCDGLLS